MDREQVTRFLEEHKRRYPALGRWLRDNGAQLEIWSEMLEHVELDDALEASRRLYEQRDQPRGYSRHPAIIRSIAGEVHVERTGGDDCEWRRCGRCQGTGWVSVLSPACLTALHLESQDAVTDDVPMDGDDRLKRAMVIARRKQLEFCSILCDCGQGARLSLARRTTPIARYAADHMLITHEQCLRRSIDQGIEVWDAAMELLIETANAMPPAAVSVDNWSG